MNLNLICFMCHRIKTDRYFHVQAENSGQAHRMVYNLDGETSGLNIIKVGEAKDNKFLVEEITNDKKIKQVKNMFLLIEKIESVGIKIQ